MKIHCAAHEGLGACWIGAFNEDEVKEILDIPPHIRVVELLSIGYPVDKAKKEKQRLTLDIIVKYAKW